MSRTSDPAAPAACLAVAIQNAPAEGQHDENGKPGNQTEFPATCRVVGCADDAGQQQRTEYRNYRQH